MGATSFHRQPEFETHGNHVSISKLDTDINMNSKIISSGKSILGSSKSKCQLSLATLHANFPPS